MDIRNRVQNLVFVVDRLTAITEDLDAHNSPLQVALELCELELRTMKRELLEHNIRLAMTWKDIDDQQHPSR